MLKDGGQKGERSCGAPSPSRALLRPSAFAAFCGKDAVHQTDDHNQSEKAPNSEEKTEPFPYPAPHAQQHPNLTSPILNPVDALVFLDCSSGTTGAPKGICCPHRGAVHSYHHRLVNFPYSEGDREACHVFFVWELLRPLLGGMDSAGGVAVPLYVIPDDHIYDPPRCHYRGVLSLLLPVAYLRLLCVKQCSPPFLI